MYSGCGHCSLSVCLCVGVWVCVCVCLSVDSGALMLKDVSSFLHCTWLLWRSCWAALMSRMCHCRTFSSETTARGDQNGMFILSIASPSRYFCVCHSFFYSGMCIGKSSLSFCAPHPPPLESHKGKKSTGFTGNIHT